MAQLSTKQHKLLSEIDTIKKEYQDHNDKVLNKFVSIIGGIVEQGLAPRIANTDFAVRDQDFPYEKVEDIKCCVFLEGISNSTRKLHQVLNVLLPPDHLQDVFSRIFAHLDEKIPSLLIAAASSQVNGSPSFQLPTTDSGKRRLILEVLQTTKTLNSLDGVHPWDFTSVDIMERRMDYKLPESNHSTDIQEAASNGGEVMAEVVAEGEAADTNTDDDNVSDSENYVTTQPQDSEPLQHDTPSLNGDSVVVPESDPTKENEVQSSKAEKFEEPSDVTE